LKRERGRVFPSPEEVLGASSGKLKTCATCRGGRRKYNADVQLRGRREGMRIEGFAAVIHECVAATIHFRVIASGKGDSLAKEKTKSQGHRFKKETQIINGLQNVSRFGDRGRTGGRASGNCRKRERNHLGRS